MERIFEDTEFKLHEATEEINEIARDFFATHPEINKAIRNAKMDLRFMRSDADETDEGDRELIRAYGKFFELVGKQLQSI